MSERTCRQRLGAALRDQRKLLDLTQAEVAELAGTTQRSVSQVETGKAASIDLYAAVCAVIGLELIAVPRRRRMAEPGAS
jgi:transcriptional regulator with XRE-family HTH domain